MKYLLMFALLGIIWWLWRKPNQPQDRAEANRAEPAPEKMVTCAYCAVHLPESEGLFDGDYVYCCEAHRVAAQTRKS